MSSPTQRSLEYARKHGQHAEVVERHNSFSGKKIDLCGCIDLIVLTGSEIWGIQATSGTNHSARSTKALTDPKVTPRLALWLASGGRFFIWSWEQPRSGGKRIKGSRWKLREQELTAADLLAAMSRTEAA